MCMCIYIYIYIYISDKSTQGEREYLCACKPVSACMRTQAHMCMHALH